MTVASTMQIYFATIDGRSAFLVLGLHEIPPDAVRISAEQHEALLAGQSTGLEIVSGEDGRPTLQPPSTRPASEADYQQAIAAHVEAVARERRYSSSAACASYVTSAVPVWAAEAAAFIAWRDAVYIAAFEELALVLSGQKEPPSVEDFVASIPPITWPEAAP